MAEDLHTVLALDYGDARVGVALGNTIARIANPKEVLANDEQLMPSIQKLILDNRVDNIVVGLPRNMDGTIGSQATKAENFASELRNVSKVPVTLHEEALSSIEAAEQYPNVAVDAAAAAVILQRYFEESTQTGEYA
ncbi:MAG: putative pre6S rRNA nuclease [Patescibacteria group bacterium]|nr:Holliday junction resolvase RuvX [Candidatus Saccharibacteria bacterium]MDQ5963531.1 putative pre6S rRNA nuclease [Patescibacteria group bacterium]